MSSGVRVVHALLKRAYLTGGHDANAALVVPIVALVAGYPSNSTTRPCTAVRSFAKIPPFTLHVHPLNRIFPS